MKGVIAHEVTVVFAAPQKREDGVVVQLQFATCSCGWKSDVQSYWGVHKAMNQHLEGSGHL